MDHRMDAAAYSDGFSDPAGGPLVNHTPEAIGEFFDRFQETHRVMQGHTGSWVVRLPERRGNMEPKHIRIRPVLNGWRVEVGCQEVVFTNADELLGELRTYLLDPGATEKRYVKESVNADLFATAYPDDDEGGAPEPPPVWEQIVQRLDMADERLRNVERNLDGRVDHNSQRLDLVESTRGGWTDRVSHWIDRLDREGETRAAFIDAQARRGDELSDRITELQEGVVTRLNAHSECIKELEGEVPRWRQVLQEVDTEAG